MEAGQDCDGASRPGSYQVTKLPCWSAPSIQSDKSEGEHQRQALGQPGNESALEDEVPQIITAREVDAPLIRITFPRGGLMELFNASIQRGGQG